MAEPVTWQAFVEAWFPWVQACALVGVFGVCYLVAVKS